MIFMFFKAAFLLFFTMFSLNLYAVDTTVEGKVIKAFDDFFILQVSGQQIYVEMDDRDLFKEGYNIFEDDHVVVRGSLDIDSLKKRKIEASSVYVKDTKMFYQASMRNDEVEPVHLKSSRKPINKPFKKDVISGKILSMDENSFLMETSEGRVLVSVNDVGISEIRNLQNQYGIGDQVKVFGTLTDRDASFDEFNASWMLKK